MTRVQVSNAAKYVSPVLRKFPTKLGNSIEAIANTEQIQAAARQAKIETDAHHLNGVKATFGE